MGGTMNEPMLSSQFLAKKLAFFSQTNVMIKILHNLALF
jgi:hypothetical protein